MVLGKVHSNSLFLLSVVINTTSLPFIQPVIVHSEIINFIKCATEA